jgi:hypothetical protein
MEGGIVVIPTVGDVLLLNVAVGDVGLRAIHTDERRSTGRVAKAEVDGVTENEKNEDSVARIAYGLPLDSAERRAR